MPKALIKLGYSCNNSCLFCHAKQFGKSELSTAEAIEKIQKAKRIGIDEVVLSGGEATIRKDFFRIISSAREKGLKVSLASNGRMLSQKAFALRCKDLGLSSVFISLHSHDEGVHNLLSRDAAFSQTVEGIRNCVSERIPVVISCVVNKMNYNQLRKLCDFAAELRAARVKLMCLNLNGEAAKSCDTVLVKVSEAGKNAADASDYALHKIPVGLEGFPLCCIGGRKELSESIMDNDIAFMSESEEKEFFRTDNGPRIKTDKCRECIYVGSCPGIDEGYYKMIGDSELTPSGG